MNFLIGDKVEAALALLVTPVAAGLSPGIRVVTGKSETDKVAPPLIVCSAEEDGDEEPKHSGNFFVNCSVAIKCSAVTNEDGNDNPSPNPKSADQSLVAAVFTILRVSNLDALLTAAVPDFTVFPDSVMHQGTERGRDRAGFWWDILHFRCLACGSSLAP